MAIRSTYFIFCCGNRNWDSPELKGQVHDSAQFSACSLIKCYFYARTCCIVYESNMMS